MLKFCLLGFKPALSALEYLKNQLHLVNKGISKVSGDLTEFLNVLCLNLCNVTSRVTVSLFR